MSSKRYRKAVPNVPSLDTFLIKAIRQADSVSLVADVHRVADEQYKQAIQRRESIIAYNAFRAKEYAELFLQTIDDNPEANAPAILSSLVDCCSNKQLDTILKRFSR